MANGEGKPERFIPLGTPSAIRERETLPSVEVDNEVVWVNEEMQLPFKIELGERCNLGLLLSISSSAVMEADRSFPLGIMEAHNRSGLLGRVVYADTQGRRYRDTNIKGIGKVSWEGKRSYASPLSAHGVRYDSGRAGICNWGYAERDRDRTEFFLRRGLRAHRTIAILRLNELLLSNGEKISIDAAKRRGLIDEDEEPVIQIRAYGTQARVQNISDNHYQYLTDAIQMVAQELGKKTLTDEEYIKWFAETLGTQVAILHTHGHTHRYLTDHNITLDCRITDFDSVDRFSNSANPAAEVEIDIKKAYRTLDSLITDVGYYKEPGHPEYIETDEFSVVRNEARKLFFKAYTKRLNNTRLRKDKVFMNGMTHRCTIGII